MIPKFKLWNVQEKKWIEDFLLLPEGGFELPDFDAVIGWANIEYMDANYSLFMSTGLRDKNGVEIYGGTNGRDGDVVEATHKHLSRFDTFTITWDEKWFTWKAVLKSGEHIRVTVLRMDDLEIIGNTVENPEMVETHKREEKDNGDSS